MLDAQKMFLIGLLLILFIIVFYEIFRKKEKKNKEGFRKCICSSHQAGRESDCQETETVQTLYDDNKLTEFTNLKSRGWTKVSPGDISFPVSEGCPWPDNHKNAKDWQAWDFTQFGS